MLPSVQTLLDTFKLRVLREIRVADALKGATELQ